MKFYENIEKIAKRKNLKWGWKTNMQKICGVTGQNLYDYRTRKVIPRIDIVIKIAHFLDCSIDELITGENYEPKHEDEYIQNTVNAMYRIPQQEVRQTISKIMQAFSLIKNTKTPTLSHSILEIVNIVQEENSKTYKSE